MIAKFRLFSMFLAALLLVSQGSLHIAFAATHVCEHKQMQHSSVETESCCKGKDNVASEKQEMAKSGCHDQQSDENPESQDCCDCKCCDSVAHVPVVNLPTHLLIFVRQIESTDQPINATHPLGWLPSPDQPPQLV